MNFKLQEFLQKGLPIGRIIGVRVRLHFTLLLSLLLFMQYFGAGSSFFNALLSSLLFAIILFGSVLLHELGHCYGAQLVGGFAHEIILWPLGGMALVGGTNRNPKTDLIVTALGPAVSVALALIGWLAYSLMGLIVSNSFILGLLEFFTLINTMLAAFNLLCPLFPMDSARIVRALFSMYYHPNRVTHYLCTFGMYLGGVLAFASFFWSAGLGILFFIGLFGAFACYQELQLNKHYPVYSEYYDQIGLRGLSSMSPHIGGFKALWDSWFSSRSQSGSIRKKGRRQKSRKRRASPGPAIVVDIVSGGKSSGKKKSPKGSDADLYSKMLDAAEREDFAEAARLRDLINKQRK